MAKSLNISGIFLVVWYMLTGGSIVAQPLPAERSVNLTSAGVSYPGVVPATTLSIISYGGSGDGNTPNDAAISAAINALSGGGIITFPAGIYLFNNTIHLNSNLTLKGAGSEQTALRFSNLAANVHLISATGSTTTVKSNFSLAGVRNSNQLEVGSTSGLSVGDYIRISQDDASLVFSPWAVGSTGQIERITAINNRTITIASTLRLDYPLSRSPMITKILPKSNIAIECLKIDRVAISTDPAVQVSNIYFNKVVQSRIRGVESNVSSFAHIQLDESANIDISGSWFHHGQDYGPGGRAYGVVCQSSTNLCLIYNNIFNDLRHSYLLQAGANGNVFSHNFSTNPYRSEIPTDFSADVVLHGNYVFANLIEGNQVSQITLDDSHGANGPYNLFLRNRTNGLGISVLNGDDQSFVGNEVTGYKLYGGVPVPNWYIGSSNHYIAGNKVLNTNGDGSYSVMNNGTVATDISFFYSQKPSFFKLNNSWPVFGNTVDLTIGNDAAKRFTTNQKVICPNESPLPVLLLNFEAKPSECANKLTWKSELEHNFDHFEIERGVDGIHFQKIGETMANGTGSIYMFEDHPASTGLTYYRLKLIDSDQSYSYSRLVSVQNACPGNHIYLTPAISNEKVSLHNLTGGETISLYDILGRCLKKKNAENEVEELDLKGLVTGLYVVTVTDQSGRSQKFRVVKIH